MNRQQPLDLSKADPTSEAYEAGREVARLHRKLGLKDIRQIWAFLEEWRRTKNADAFAGFYAEQGLGFVVKPPGPLPTTEPVGPKKPHPLDGFLKACRAARKGES